MKEDALLSTLGFTRPYGVSMVVLLAYWAVLRLLTFAALVIVARRERR